MWLLLAERIEREMLVDRQVIVTLRAQDADIDVPHVADRLAELDNILAAGLGADDDDSDEAVLMRAVGLRRG